jgi:tol-pal system protein YbgF
MTKKIIFILIFIFSSSIVAVAPVVDYSSSVDRAESGLEKSGTISMAESTADNRVNKLEQQVNNINEQNLTNKIEELQQRLQKLNGQIEDQEHQIEQLNSQLRSFYQDLNQRLENLRTNGAKITPPVLQNKKTETFVDGNIVEVTGDNVKPRTDKEFLKEQQMYQTAIDLLPDKKYEASGDKLRDYLKLYPKGVYVASAHYWLGEINFLQKNYDAAEEEFKIIIDKYPKSKRVSDAMFKLALVHQNQGRESQAKKELRQIIKRYPHTSASQLAKLQLEGN